MYKHNHTQNYEIMQRTYIDRPTSFEFALISYVGMSKPNS